MFREFYQEDKLEGAFATFRSIAIVEGDVRARERALRSLGEHCPLMLWLVGFASRSAARACNKSKGPSCARLCYALIASGRGSPL